MIKSDDNLFKTNNQGSILYEESGIEIINFGNKFIKQHTQNLLDSFAATYGRPMFEMSKGLTPEEKAEFVFFAPQAILSHDIRDDGQGIRENIYNYANRAALLIFERTYQEQTALASFKSAPSSFQDERNNLLGECLAMGKVIFDAERVSAKGKKILIQKGLFFNISDTRGIYRGQAVLLKKTTSKNF
ncbi:MEKHLA domain-containing protein [Desulfobacula phenolica]|uniref:MEKHLA domain-containing protein n=1 Tax=Desulfobacula phenolica TaxID=90732 RepID=A0A1H2E3G8_9BACT|nr:MEKHLA domain-containing protein [Desulfobacula phenolica]SDT89660.1 MEKHLA domain-containing protein [Desulfobacula phenolica]